MPVKGLQSVLSQLSKLPNQIQEEVRLDVEEFTRKILMKAIQNAPAAGENLKTTLGTQKNPTNIQQFLSSKIENGGLTGTVFIEAQASLLAIYIEFGTGSSAAGYVPTLPPELQRIAKLYYINGKGTLIKQPFLLPAYFENQFPFLKAVQKSLENMGLKTVLIP